MSVPAASRPSWGVKLRFAVWGIRYLDILVLMANPTLGAVVAIRQPLIVPLTRLAIFSILNFLFLTQVFIFNDWSDARLNPEEPGRRSRHALKHPALSSGELLALAAALTAVSLAGFYFIKPALFTAGLVIAVMTVLYSHPTINLKGRPVVSTVIHFLVAALQFYSGFIAFSHPTSKAVALMIFLGLVLAAGHFSNEIEDFDQDLAAGIRTNAIAFGQHTMFRVGLFLFLLSSAFLTASGLALGEPFYVACGLGLLAAWGVAAWRWRAWKGGDPIRPFRLFYRVLYALLSAGIILQRAWEWWW
jgi:4-hydroxybenzoate polyprenyltransferase